MASSTVLGTHPYQRLFNDDTVVKYENWLRLRRTTCTGQRVIAACVIGLTLIIVIFILVLFTENEKVRDKNSSRSRQFFEISAQTTCGKVMGEQIEDTYIFKGIPYALPPTGKRRWAPPQPLLRNKGCWGSSWDGTKFGKTCLQVNPISRNVEGSESCLYLNVWTPSIDDATRLPVVVFIHGGNLLWGSGQDSRLIPDINLVHQFNFVFVSFNYRLSALGFLSLELLSNRSSTKTSGNYGLQDQIMALKWVQENILSFGGDPNKVTLFGQGSGGSCALALLTSPKAKGLFQRAWLSSPSTNIISNLNEAEHINKYFLSVTKCNTLNCLLQLRSDVVQIAVSREWGMEEKYTLPMKGGFNNPLIIIDGDVIPDTIQNSIKNDKIADIPLLIGSAAQEVESLFSPSKKDAKYWKNFHYIDYIREKLNTFQSNTSEIALKLYLDGLDPLVRLISMISDVRSICPINSFAREISRISSSIYRYIVTTELSTSIKLPYSFEKLHFSFNSIDLIAFFGQIQHYVLFPTQDDLNFQLEIQAMAMEFIRCGSMQMSSWKSYPRVIAQISNQTKFYQSYLDQKCNFWSDFEAYSWNN